MLHFKINSNPLLPCKLTGAPTYSRLPTKQQLLVLKTTAAWCFRKLSGLYFIYKDCLWLVYYRYAAAQLHRFTLTAGLHVALTLCDTLESYLPLIANCALPPAGYTVCIFHTQIISLIVCVAGPAKTGYTGYSLVLELILSFYSQVHGYCTLIDCFIHLLWWKIYIMFSSGFALPMKNKNHISCILTLRLQSYDMVQPIIVCITQFSGSMCCNKAKWTFSRLLQN